MAGTQFSRDRRLAAGGFACLLLLGTTAACADEAGEAPVTGLTGPGIEADGGSGEAAGQPLATSGGTADSELPPAADDPRIAAYEQMLELLDAKEYEAAVDAASTVLELSEAAFGSDSLKLVAPLNNLASTQRLAGRLEAAEANYKRSIRLTERKEGILSKRLINAYVGLGDTYLRAGLYAQARDAFDHALRINHVNEGFYNAEQLKIRDGLTESYLGLQELDKAGFQQEIQLEINARRLGRDSPELAPAMYKLARWYERNGQFELARSTYESAKRLLSKAYGKNSEALIDALVGIADTYEREDLTSESARALKRSLRILEANGSDDVVRRVDLLVRLGDLYTRSGKTDTGRSYYSEAWQLLSADEDRLEQREQLFGSPQRIAGVRFDALRFGPGVKTDDDSLADGWVQVRFDVDERGRARNIAVVEADPPGLLDKRVVNIIARSWFRPRFADGRPVATEGLMYRHDYRYRPAAAASEAAEQDADEARPRHGRIEYPDDNGSDD
ncbi:MAG: hypothetical protein D6727_03515 [Gammaproteobacteria bacterium]|nr:MAG: hypothetical protein D6727_03515 [Gammaproteobacteria bacterium]